MDYSDNLCYLGTQNPDDDDDDDDHDGLPVMLRVIHIPRAEYFSMRTDIVRVVSW